MSGRRNRVTDAPLLAWGDAIRSQKLRRSRRRKRLAIAAAGITIVLASALRPPAPRVVWNASASAPRGLYIVTPHAPPVVGNMVIAWPPKAYQPLAAARHYLPIHVPLVKRVAAVSGDEVCALGPVIFINGRPAARRTRVDGQGQPLPFWTGCRVLHGRQLFLLMDQPASFDGRYFGVTEGEDVIGTARLLWRR